MDIEDRPTNWLDTLFHVMDEEVIDITVNKRQGEVTIGTHGPAGHPFRILHRQPIVNNLADCAVKTAFRLAAKKYNKPKDVGICISCPKVMSCDYGRFTPQHWGRYVECAHY